MTVDSSDDSTFDRQVTGDSSDDSSPTAMLKWGGTNMSNISFILLVLTQPCELISIDSSSFGDKNKTNNGRIYTCWNDVKYPSTVAVVFISPLCQEA